MADHFNGLTGLTPAEAERLALLEIAVARLAKQRELWRYRAGMHGEVDVNSIKRGNGASPWQSQDAASYALDAWAVDHLAAAALATLPAPQLGQIADAISAAWNELWDTYGDGSASGTRITTIYDKLLAAQATLAQLRSAAPSEPPAPVAEDADARPICESCQKPIDGPATRWADEITTCADCTPRPDEEGRR